MRSNKGFTLIEILVVISIIGLLMVFLVPKLAGFQDRAKEAAVKAVMHNVQLSIEAYQMENTVYPIASNVTVEKLFEDYLSTGGYMLSLPKNPFTNLEYSEDDKAGQIIYDYDSSSGKYMLVGYKRNGSTKLLEISNM